MARNPRPALRRIIARAERVRTSTRGLSGGVGPERRGLTSVRQVSESVSPRYRNCVLKCQEPTGATASSMYRDRALGYNATYLGERGGRERQAVAIKHKALERIDRRPLRLAQPVRNRDQTRITPPRGCGLQVLLELHPHSTAAASAHLPSHSPSTAYQLHSSCSSIAPPLRETRQCRCPVV